MPEAARHHYYAPIVNMPGDVIKTEPKDSPTRPAYNFLGNYRPPHNESPSPIERSPMYGSTTPVGPTSPYDPNGTSVTPTPGGYQPNLMNPDFMLGGNQQFQQNQYAFLTPSPTNGQPMFVNQQPQQQQQQQHQFQPPANMNNPQQQFNVSNLINLQELAQPGPSGVQPAPSFQPTATSIGEVNLSSLLNMDSTELKSLMANFSTSDIKQEQQRIQQEAENLSGSFTKLTTNDLNNLNR